MRSIVFLLVGLLVGLETAQAYIVTQERGRKYIISNLETASLMLPDPGPLYDFYPKPGSHRKCPPQRAVMFRTHSNYYGITYQVQNILLHRTKFHGQLNEHWDLLRWPKPMIYADAMINEGPDTSSSGYLGGFQKWEYLNFPANLNLVRMEVTSTNNIILHSNRNYWLVIDTGFDPSNFAHRPYLDVSIEFFKAPGTNKQRSSSAWKIGDNEMYKSGGVFRWANPPTSPPLQFALNVDERRPDAFEIGDTLSPGNLAEPNVDFSGDERNRGINNDRWVATRFWTISTGDTPPHKFRLDHVTMLNNIRSYQNYNDGNHVIAIYDDDRSGSPPVPGREIGRFSQDLPEIINGEFEGSVSSDNNQQHRFHADPDQPILLNPWTGYWLVQKMEDWDSGSDSVTHLGMPSFTRSKNANGWPMGNYYFRSYNRGRNWLEVNQVHGTHNDWTMRFGFGATVVNSQPGDINLDGSINVFDLVLLNDHARYLHPLPQSVFYLGNLNADSGSSIINHHDRDLLLDLILEK